MYAFKQLTEEIGAIDKKDILMAGDTLETDILGGNKFGVQTVLVLSGISEENTQLLIQSKGIIPDYICK